MLLALVRLTAAIECRAAALNFDVFLLASDLEAAREEPRDCTFSRGTCVDGVLARSYRSGNNFCNCLSKSRPPALATLEALHTLTLYGYASMCCFTHPLKPQLLSLCTCLKHF